MAPGDVGITLSELLQRPAWMADALCREHPEVAFFPERGKSAADAVAICARCLVRDECLAFALEQDSTTLVGVWGGTTARSRRELRTAAADRPARSHRRWTTQEILDALARWLATHPGARQQADRDAAVGDESLPSPSVIHVRFGSWSAAAAQAAPLADAG